MVTDWRDMVEMSRPSGSKSESKRSKSGSQQVSHVSSNLSIISKKREEIALAQLKLEELKVRQGFEEKEQELKRMKELAEAEMKVKRAAVSLEIYQQAEEERGNRSKGDILEENFMLSSSPSVKEQLQENVVGSSQHKVVKSSASIPEPTNSPHKEFVGGLSDRRFPLKNDLPLLNVRRKRNVLPDQMQTPSTTFEIYRPIPFEQQPFAPGPLPFVPPQVVEDPNVPVALLNKMFKTFLQHVPTTSVPPEYCLTPESPIPIQLSGNHQWLTSQRQ
jgi:hypothetical protein